jgi:hypothetical protein
MNKPTKKERKVIWEEVEDPDFDEHLRRIFEAIMRGESEPKQQTGEESPGDASIGLHSP